jgi:CPA1 family monovalent cation:H+ antiporter
VAELLHGLLRAREQENERTLEGLRLQYPGYAEELDRRFIRRTALRLEAREYTILHEDGLISPELYATLMRQVEAAHGEISGRPKLDLAVQKIELVSRFPLFQALDKKTRKRLVRALNTRYAEPGEILFGRENSSKSVYFIASGAVEITTANQKHRLGRGEMFGQLALLMKGHKRSEVVAISHCTLLELGEARFLRLLKRNTSLRDAVEHSAVKRGVVLKLPDTGRNLRDAPAPAAQLTPADGDEEAS